MISKQTPTMNLVIVIFNLETYQFRQMKSFFKELLEYNHHCNQELGDVFYEHPDKTSEKAIKLYSHLLNAHRIWNSRIEPGQKVFAVWELHPIQNCKHIDKMNYEHSLLILDRFSLDKNIGYTNTRGEAFNSNIRDMLFHVINHSTYHRGQIATDFRQSGLEPLISDYIFYKRQIREPHK